MEMSAEDRTAPQPPALIAGFHGHRGPRRIPLHREALGAARLPDNAQPQNRRRRRDGLRILELLVEVAGAAAEHGKFPKLRAFSWLATAPHPSRKFRRSSLMGGGEDRSRPQPRRATTGQPPAPVHTDLPFPREKLPGLVPAVP